MRILVTGGAGYIGSVLVRRLLAAGHEVRVLDLLRYGGDSLAGLAGHPRLEVVAGDIRDGAAVADALAGVGAVAHLAAIVGDPACAREPELARSVNLEATVGLYERAEAAGAARFVFASTCSNYGRGIDPEAYVDERAELRPLSLYAETKVAAERFLLDRPPGSACKPTCLRFATVHGLSPRPRFDLTVNEFTRDLALGRELLVFGERFWRPYCHVEDLARSVALALEAPEGSVAFEVYNVGDTAENYTKRMVVEAILAEVPGGRVRYVHRDEDPRDYRVDFAKVRDRLGFRPTRRLTDGIREIARAVAAGRLGDPDDPRYSNTPGPM